MAARNAADTIGPSVESVLNQDYPGRVELIVVDDASSDSTASIVSAYEGVLLVRNQAQQGRSLSRNRGLQHVDTDLVAIQDADDISRPERLKETVPLIAGTDNRIVGGQVLWVDEGKGHFQGGMWPTSSEETGVLLKLGRMPLAHPTMILPTKLIREAKGYDARFPVAEDLDLLLRLKKAFPRLEIVNSASPVATYRRARIDPLKYLTHSAYWRAQVMGVHHPLCEKPAPFEWFYTSLEGYLRQRARLVKKVLVNNEGQAPWAR